MKHVIMALGALIAVPVAAQGVPVTGSGKAALGEVWVWPVMFQQALAPLAPLSGRVVREGLCPDIRVGDDRVLYKYDVEAKFRSRGVENKRWEVRDLRIVNPSGCAAMDAEVATLMRQAVPQFAEPREDSDKNGWTRIPRIELRVVD